MHGSFAEQVRHANGGAVLFRMTSYGETFASETMEYLRFKTGLSNPSGTFMQGVGDGCILAEECRAPVRSDDIGGALRPKPKFLVQFSNEMTPSVKCLMQWSKPHNGEIILSSESKTFQFKCCQVKEHSHLQRHRIYGTITDAVLGASRDPQVAEWLQKEFEYDGSEGAREMQLVIDHRFHFSETVSFQRVEVQPDHSNFLFQPGIFKGTYSAHGIELILVTFEDHEIVGKKLSGDPNIPAGKISFRADVNAPLKTPCKRADIEAQTEPTLKNEVEKMLSESRESLLDHAYYSMYQRYPDKSLARFKGQGHVAFTGFVEDNWIDGEFVVFSRDVFGFLFKEIQSMVVLQRTDEPFDRPR